MKALEKPGWKQEAQEGLAFQSPFDKYAFLAQICYQIMVWDLSIERRLFRTLELLSYLTDAEKKQFQINPKDEKMLNMAISHSRENKRLMKALESQDHNRFWNGQYHVDTQLLRTNEVEYKKTSKPKIKTEALTKRIADLIKNKTLFGLEIDPKRITYKVTKKYLSSDDEARFSKDCIYKRSEYTTYVFYIEFYTGSAWLHEKMRIKNYDTTMDFQHLIGRILQPMLDAFEGKKILMIPEERKIP